MIRWLRRLWAREPRPIAADAGPTIKPPVYHYTTFDPALRDRTAARRKAAQGIHKRAHAVESGAKTADVLRRVK